MRKKNNKFKKTHQLFPVEVKGVNKEKGTLEAIFSTQDVDRHGDIVMQDGFDLKNFNKNPVILNSHNYYDATEVIGRASNVRVENKKLQGTITFAIAENPKAKVIFDLYAGKFLNAFSVGFMPKKFKENKDGSRDWGVIEEAELLEVSAVSVPANARALAKQKGIDVDILEVKNNENHDDDDEEETLDDESTEDIENQGGNGEDTPDDSDDSDEGDDEEDLEEGDADEEDDEGDDNAGDQDGEGDGEEAEEEGEDSESDEEAEDPADGDGDPAPEGEPEKPKSYKAKYAGVIKSIQAKDREAIRTVARALKSIQDNENRENLDRETKARIKKRKVNMAIRALMKIR